MTRVADRVTVIVIARITWTGPRVLSIDFVVERGRVSNGPLFDDVVDRAQGPCPCAILIRFRLNKLATPLLIHQNKARQIVYTSRHFPLRPVWTTNSASDLRFTAKEYIRTPRALKGFLSAITWVGNPADFDRSR